MKRSKPVASVLVLILAAAAVVAGWKGWQRLALRGEPALSAGSDGPSSATSAIGSIAQAEPSPVSEVSPMAANLVAPTGDAENEGQPDEAQKPIDEPTGESMGLVAEPPAPDGEDADVDRAPETQVASAVADETSSIQARFGPNAVPPDDGGACPPDHPVKGNTNSMIFHLPGQSTYGATIAGVCFADGDAAQEAGFRPRKR